MSHPIRGWGGHLILSDRPKKHKLDRGHWDRTSCQVSLNFSAVAEKKSKMSQPIRGRGGHLVFLRLAWNDTNWVGYVEILLPVNFRWIPFNGFRGEVKKLKMSQQIRCQGGHLVFQTGSKNTNLIEDVEILLPVKFRWIPYSGLEEKSKIWKVNDDGRTLHYAWS